MPKDYGYQFYLHRKLVSTNKVPVLQRWIPEVAMAFIMLRETWKGLVPTRKNDSLSQVKRFFNCVRAIMSINIRSMAIASLEDFKRHLKTYAKGNDFDQSGYHEGQFLNPPLLNIKLLAKDGKVEFSPSLEETKVMMVDCLKEIVRNTQNFPRIEKELFPEMADLDMFLLSVDWEEDYIQDICNKVSEVFDANAVGPMKYIKMYEKYSGLLSGQADKERNDFLSIKDGAPLGDFKSNMDRYRDLSKEINAIRDCAMLNMFEVDATTLNAEMSSHANSLRDSLIQWQVDTNRTWNRQICNQFDDMATRLGEIPEKTKELVELQRYLKTSMTETMPGMMAMIGVATQRVLFLLDCTILPTEDIQLNTRVFQWPKDMASVFELAKTRTGHRRDQVEEDLRSRIDQFEDHLKSTSRELDFFMKKDPPVLTMDEMKSSIQVIDRLEAKTKEAVVDLRNINQEEVFLDWDPSSYPLLQKIQQSVEKYSNLWHTALTFHEKYERWYYGPLKGLDTDEIQEQVESLYSSACHLSKIFSTTPTAKRIADTIRTKIEKFKAHMPVLHTLCNPGLRERHWQQISLANGGEIKRDDETTSLHDMIEAGLNRIIDKLEEIGVTATKEFALETAMEKMKAEWEAFCFECVPYRESGVSILSGVEDVQQMLDDHILKAQTMHSSAYIKPFEEEMRQWEEKLLSMQDILDAWLRCQESWLYLEPIFNSEDIMKQMPVEGRKFNKVDRIWRNIMAKTVADPHVLQATNQPNMLVNLQEANELLDEIMKGLNDYLEKKRLFFPRFFFLSNDELLEILSETKDPLRVQPHVKKCFEGIDQLKFRKDKFGNQDVVGMVSSDGEQVPFSNTIFPADAKGMVEKWLLQVEKQMIQSLRDIMSKGVKAYHESELQEWITKWPGQVVSCARSINWTAEVSDAIEKGTPVLKKYLKTFHDQIINNVDMVRQGLSPIFRKILQSMIILDLYFKTVMERLIKNGVSDVEDFTWVSNLRYYLIKDPNQKPGSESGSDNVAAKMIHTTVDYGFEYLGNSSRLVMTPLTERCLRTLMCALKLKLGGAPTGPSGSGKSESVKDLAKAVAKQCVVFNCSDGIDFHAMAKFLKGLAQSGAWSCFDEFNRIDMDVLSVVAQQIQTIHNAVMSGLTTFDFEGAELTLNPSCSVFVTLTPSMEDETRHDIPDNLKLLFRPVAMTLPDVGMVAEITLYSLGFTRSKDLSRVLVETFKLFSEQLSVQNHYDFGLRAIRSVLNATKNIQLSRVEHDDDEMSILYKAVMDVNLPKFVSDDLPLVEGIMKDMFKIKPLQIDRGVMKERIKAVCKAQKVQPTNWFVNKVVQLYEMIRIQHGIVIIGETMSCKTVLYRVLAEVLTSLAEDPPDKDASITEYRTIYKVINPKSITMTQLYGLFDPYTHEWSDGVLGGTFRDMATSTNEERKWIVFDGPVDPSWIENLNTVLDDSKKLCLMNGEIIHMSKWMNVLFEMADLDKASPATVGRCGMVYLESQQLGWRPLKQSFLDSLPSSVFAPDQISSLDDMFEWLLPAVFRHVMTLTLSIRYSELHLFSSMIKILKSLILTVDHSTQQQHQHQQKQAQSDQQQTPTFSQGADTIHIQMAFLFATVWGICSTITSQPARKSFDVHFRNLVDGLVKGHAKPASFKLARSNLYPDTGSVFDYALDPTKPGVWTQWSEQMNNPEDQFASSHDEEGVLIVPTAETVKQSYFLRLALSNSFPLGLIGSSGTGKSFITNSFIRRLSKEKFVTNVINFSARTNVNYTQEVIMSKLDRRRKGVFGPAMGKKCIIFIDDLNLPQRDSSGSIPAIELLRQWIDHGHWYDKKDSSKLELLDVHLLTAMSPASSGRSDITPRFLRHMNILTIDQFDDGNMRRIFSTEVDWHFKDEAFEAAIVQLSGAIVDATLSLYKGVLSTFLPTPSKCHYMFNLRDFAKVIQGIKLVPASHLRDPNKLIRLWCHEAYRVFYDRLVEVEDRKQFFGIVKACSQSAFKVDLVKILFPHVLGGSSVVEDEHLRCLCFGDYMHPEADKKIYDEIPDASLQTKAMEHYLKEYNSVSTAPMPLVMFRVCHRARVEDQQNHTSARRARSPCWSRRKRKAIINQACSFSCQLPTVQH